MRISLVSLLLVSLLGCGQFEGKEGPQGPKGKAGAQGPAGEKGEPGDAGVSAVLEAKECSRNMLYGQIAYPMTYKHTKLADESVMLWWTYKDNKGRIVFSHHYHFAPGQKVSLRNSQWIVWNDENGDTLVNFLPANKTYTLVCK